MALRLVRSLVPNIDSIKTGAKRKLKVPKEQNKADTNTDTYAQNRMESKSLAPNAI